MKHWINKNYKTLIVLAFLVPIIIVAIVSISHVTQWYGVSNPLTWAIYLSVGVEIAAMSAVAALSANVGKNIYIPFVLVTLIQFIGNVFFSYEYIDIDAESFRSWVELVSPIFEFGGVDSTNFVAHKRILALLAGGMLPVISLTFLHMLVRFTEEQRLQEIEDEKTKNTKNDTTVKTNNDTDDVNLMDEKIKIEEKDKIKLTPEELDEINHRLNKKPKTKEEVLKDMYGDNQEPTLKKTEDVNDTILDEENIEHEDELEEEIVNNFIKERTGYIKPEIEDESWDAVRDEVLNDLDDKNNLPNEEEKKN